jgi:hypothetical protein
VQSKLGRRFIAAVSLSPCTVAVVARPPLPARITTFSSSSSSESIGDNDNAGALKQHDNTRNANDGPAASAIGIAPDDVSLPIAIRPLDCPPLVIIRVRSSSYPSSLARIGGFGIDRGWLFEASNPSWI